MPKLDLTQVVQMKNSSGEIIAFKGNGFSWAKATSAFIDLLISDVSVGIVHGPQGIAISDLTVGIVHGGQGITLVDLSAAVVFGPTASHITLTDLSVGIVHSGV